jgi:predicted N-acetyltransferase YhbS
MRIVRIAEAGPTDLDATLSIERATFAHDDEAELVAALLQDPTARPSLSLLAIVDSKRAESLTRPEYWCE